MGCSNMQREKLKKPNIIYILADDMGYGDLKSLNPESRIPTPNMDKIVQQGVHFTDAHSNSAVCTPTRYGILTGRYAFRTSLKNGVLWGYSPSLIEPERETVASFLKHNGYQTACIGKWHLGLDWAKKDTTKEIPEIKWDEKVSSEFNDNVDYTKYVKGGPSDHGFDYSLVIPASLDINPYCYIRNGKTLEDLTTYTEGKKEATDGRGVFWRPGKMSPGFNFYKVLPNFVDSACQYIQHTSNQEKPFFLYLALPSPHTPWLPAPENNGRSKAGRYGDYVSMVDDMIGKVLNMVETSGIEENTLIIVTSDNGSDWRPTDIEETGHHANYIYKGRKADIYEAGHRIPFIARWKGVIPAGIKSDEVMCTTDLMATLAGMLKLQLSKNAGEDSYNLWPVFIGKVASSPIREATVHHSLDGFFSIRKGKWKFTPHLGSGGFSVPKLVVPNKGDATGTLYDIENDPQEKNNLYKENQAVVTELSQLLERYKNQGYSRPLSEDK
ncbi:MAG: sulfatase-like hydrolase/transferase [Mariniphaga sp.]|nr:sulfatase-like hydrolase/transferase [Mariniphaga sp.]